MTAAGDTPLSKSLLPVLGVLLLTGKGIQEPQCTGELHCPSSGIFPTREAVLKDEGL